MKNRRNMTHVMEIIQSHIANLCQSGTSEAGDAGAALRWFKADVGRQPPEVNQWMNAALRGKVGIRNCSWDHVGRNGRCYHDRVEARLERFASKDIRRMWKLWHYLNDIDEADQGCFDPNDFPRAKVMSDIGQPTDDYGPEIIEEIEEIEPSN
jgi:hypothetical protein